jgi:hypothetical protein
MTDRELMQQALEALEQSNTKAPFGADGVVYWEGVKTHEAAIDALRKRLAQPEQEPVAWRFREAKNKPWSISDDGYYISCKRTSGYIIEPLYTAPPQRKPLTEEKIEALDLPTSGTATVRDLVRLIERAHDIGKKE